MGARTIPPSRLTTGYYRLLPATTAPGRSGAAWLLRPGNAAAQDDSALELAGGWLRPARRRLRSRRSAAEPGADDPGRPSAIDRCASVPVQVLHNIAGTVVADTGPDHRARPLTPSGQCRGKALALAAEWATVTGLDGLPPDVRRAGVQIPNVGSLGTRRTLHGSGFGATGLRGGRAVLWREFGNGHSSLRVRRGHPRSTGVPISREYAPGGSSGLLHSPRNQLQSAIPNSSGTPEPRQPQTCH